MRLRVIWTGKTKDAHLRALVDEYSKRLSHFARCEISELRESSGTEKRAGIDKDSRRISDGLREGAINVLLDPDGVEWTSQELAQQIQSWQDSGTKEVTFIIGGAKRSFNRAFESREQALESFAFDVDTRNVSRGLARTIVPGLHDYSWFALSKVTETADFQLPIVD